jgi:hypothetical protein
MTESDLQSWALVSGGGGLRPILKLHAVKAMRWPPYWVWSGGKLFTKSSHWASWVKEKQKRGKYSEKMSTRLVLRRPLLQGQSTRLMKRTFNAPTRKQQEGNFQWNVRFSIDYDGRRLRYCYGYY